MSSTNTNDLPELPPIKRPARPWDMLDKNVGRVSAEVKAERLAACEGCKFFMKLSRNCRKCGCFMDLKTQLPHAECPVGKWGTAEAV